MDNQPELDSRVTQNIESQERQQKEYMRQESKRNALSLAIEKNKGVNPKVADILQDAEEIYQWLIKDL